MRKILISLCLMVVSASYLFSQEVLYQQDFEAANAGSEWSLVQGDAVFEVGTYADIDNTSKMMVSTEVKQSIMALNGTEFEGPFTLEMESYPSFNFAGPIINYVDNDNFVCVTIDNNDKRVRVRQVVAGTWDGQFPVGDGNDWRFWKDDTYVSDSLGTDILAWGENKPASLHWKILVDPDLGTVTVYIDNNLILKDVPVVLPQYKAKVGVYTWWCKHGFDNINISEGIDPETSITKVIHKADFNIYPNPVLNGSLTIDASKISGSVNIIVYNVLGARVLSATEAGGNTIQLNVNNLKSGLYIVSLKGNNGISQQEKIYVK